jgi:hypothetical protein
MCSYTYVIYICIYVYACVYIYLCIRIYTCTYIYMNIQNHPDIALELQVYV